ncbi:apicomplexan specific protein [Cryptosporidium ryanae]|uniref:apicomplexan specific protein n=1 Tax=Cryptosporidium ryanae TaxID=515981 RepID=UPI00351A7E10|nr:apicomplexan specific protein [Cryptosporidium ryanae]
MVHTVKKEVEISNKEILKHIKKIVKPENLDILTSRKVREELEKSLGLPDDSLLHKKTEINSMLDDIILEIENRQTKKNIFTGSKEYKTEDDDISINSKVEQEDENFQNKFEDDRMSTKRKQASMMSTNDFLEKAKVINFTIDGSDITIPVKPRKFSTGSVGWYFGNKISLPVGDEDEAICQISINCTVVGSKFWTENPKKKTRK